METVDIPRFSCGACGRKFRWKPEIAGKKAKCACSASVSIPTVSQISPPSPPPADEDDLYGLVPSAAALAEAAAAPGAIPAIAAAQAAVAPLPSIPLQYRTADRAGKSGRGPRVNALTGELSDPARNLYVPLALIVTGLILLAINVFSEFGASAKAGVIVVMLVVTVIKTTILIIAAILLASAYGVGMGLLRTAILKVAGIVLFTEAAVLWVESLLGSHILGGGFIVYYIATLVMFQVGFAYLFRMSGSELKFASLIALISRVSNFLLVIVVLGIAAGMAAHVQPALPTASQVVPAIQQPRPAPVIDPAKVDSMVVQRLNSQDPLLPEARQRMKVIPIKDPDVKNLVETLYKSEAANVYLNMSATVHGRTMMTAKPTRIYVRLPADPAKRAECLKDAQIYTSDAEIDQTWDEAALSRMFLPIDLQ